uniref:Uncharacterized protein n=6 Tax=Avena sativa TaxID=4498 RepID=A0ACD5WIP3_AVESA
MPRGTAKRKREPPPPAAAAAAAGERKLLPGQVVEVISFDPGLYGSWHKAVVTGISDNVRWVRYNDFVDDSDSGSPLVEELEVSDAIDGKPIVPGGSGRGIIRPVQPHQPLQVTDAIYGLCVDALVEGSYWEGVIADHAEGSVERKVLFPDEGDERIMAVDQLRLTQDWDEVTGKWKLRGNWLFLQVLLSHEEKDGLPISVRQIWYDLRSDSSLLMDFNMWMCGKKPFWERSLAVLIAELWSVCGRTPLKDGYHSCRSAEASTSEDFQNKKVEPTVLDKADSTTADISQTMSEFISCYRSNDRVGARAKRENIKCYLKSLGWTFVEDRPKNKYCVSPDGKRFTSIIGACEAYLAQKETNNNRQDCHTHHLLLDSVTQNSECSNPAGMDLSLRENKPYNKLSTWKPEQLNAELSPLIGSLLASYQEINTISQGHINENIRMELKKHLLALGWSIEVREDKVKRHRGKLDIINKRYRYKSPAGNTYFSILKVLKTFTVQCSEQVQGNIIEDSHNYLAAHIVNPDPTVWRNLARPGKRKRGQKSDDIRKYLDYMEADEQDSRKKKRLRLKAKNFLNSAGWKLWRKKKSSKQEPRYDAPHGKSYNSLLAACKGYLAEAYQKENNANFGITTDDMFTLPTCHGKSKKRKSSSVPMSQARVLSSRHGQILSSPHHAKTVLSLLVGKNILIPRVKIIYKERSDGPQIKEGSIVTDGIKCKCCNELFTLESFEVHAGYSTHLPAAHMFLKDGRSLSQCLVELMGENKPKNSLHVRLKKNYSHIESDSICSICNDGGNIILCDGCPSSFHHACVGLQDTPTGTWYCPSCRCSICDSGAYDPDANQFTEKTIMYCDQCECEYHVGCIRNKSDQLSCCPEGCWFCSRGCSEIFQHLQKLIGKPIPTPVEGLSCTILKFDRENTSDDVNFDNEKMAEQYGKLCIALDVLHECFVTIIEPRTRRDIAEDIVFNRESELRRLNFRGFYTILLQKDGELISVGTFRICGKKFAELPLIGTRVQYRRQGMCRLIMNELEKLLSGWGVERLLLPAVPQLLATWTGSFGFTAMSNSDRFKLAESSVLSFQGTTMCQKILNDAGHNPKDMNIELVLSAEQMESGKNRIASFESTTTSDMIVNTASNHSEELMVTALTNYTSLELTENSIFNSWGTTIYQKVSNNAFSHQDELHGSEYQLECKSIVHDMLESDSQESTSVVMEDIDRLEPELLLEIRSNHGEENICAIDVPTSAPNQEVSFTGNAHGQPNARSAQRELCFDRG